MPAEHTEIQSDEDSRRARELSERFRRPPRELAGYEAERLLGSGAYGEVWLARDRNTGRRVAIKFYTHGGGLDWALLAREVEKLVLLAADRSVVQLLEVGWEAEPPYYVMEYLEAGSLERRLEERGRMETDAAVGLFRELAAGLRRAHGKGVLHCDLKPGNVLLDEDDKPRLADFGQSRLTSEQVPALGTLFYMAPEQADLKATADARWDVYALGALAYTMLTGAPPHHDPELMARIERESSLEDRLHRYRRHLETSPAPSDHHRVKGVDRGLAEIIDRCLDVDPERRFPDVQAVIEALDRRAAKRSRRPLVILGIIGPLLLTLTMAVAAWKALDTLVGQAEQALTRRALEGTMFAARLAAKAAGGDLELRYRAVEQLAADAQLDRLLDELLADQEMAGMLTQLAAYDSSDDSPAAQAARSRFFRHPARQPLQQWLDRLRLDRALPNVASWFVNDASGVQLARTPEDQTTIGKNYAWRSYFHGGPEDMPEGWRPAAEQQVRETHLSDVFRSQATGRWTLGVSTPIMDDQQQLRGIVALTSEVGRDLGVRVTEPAAADPESQFAVLADARPGKNQGLILEHRIYQRLTAGGERLPDRFADHRLPLELLARKSDVARDDYRDPLVRVPGGGNLEGRWLLASTPVGIAGQASGLVVLVQTRHDRAIGPTLLELKRSVFSIGLVAVVLAVALPTMLWMLVARARS